MAVLRDEVRGAVREEVSQELAELRRAVERLTAVSGEQRGDAGKPDYVATMEAVHADLERRHNVLLAELERRRLEGEQPKRRAWWKWWDE